MTWENTLVDRAAEQARIERTGSPTNGPNWIATETSFRTTWFASNANRRDGGEEQHVEDRTREAEVRLEQLKRHAAEWEETVTLATAEQERLRAEAERLDRHKAELDVGNPRPDSSSAGELESQQAVLAVQRAKLDRARQEAEREAAQLAIARTREDEALAELRLRIREAEELRAQLTSVQGTPNRSGNGSKSATRSSRGGLAEIREQRDALATKAERLRARKTGPRYTFGRVRRAGGMLKGRVTQALDLQARSKPTAWPSASAKRR